MINGKKNYSELLTCESKAERYWKEIQVPIKMSLGKRYVTIKRNLNRIDSR